MNDTHKIICKNQKALECLLEEYLLIGIAVKEGTAVSQGDALVGRDTLLENDFVWGRDFYIIKELEK